MLLVACVKPLVFPHHPFCECSVYLQQHMGTPRPIIPAIVIHPATHKRMNEPCDSFESLIAPSPRQTPTSIGLPDRFGRLVAHRRQETYKEPACAALDPPRLKGVSEKIKRVRFEISSPDIVLAVDYPGLVRMQFQSTLRQTFPSSLKHPLSMTQTKESGLYI